jgi:hypothetical protein
MITPSLLSRLLIAASVAGVAGGCGARTDVPFGDRNNPEGTTGGQSGAAGSRNTGGASGRGGAAGKAGTGGQAGAGGNAVCDNPNSPKLDDNGQYACTTTGTFGLCDLRCYSPGAQTFPAPCLDAKDPKLNTLPNFEFQGCGLKSIESGPFCNAEMEKFGGSKPICCYVTLSEPCAGRPLTVAGHIRLAPLVRKAYV